MGNSNNVPEQKPNFLSSATFLQTKIDSNFGELQLYTNSERPIVSAVAKRAFKNEKEFRESLQRRPRHEGVIEVIKWWGTNQKDLCSVVSILHLAFDYYPDTLEREIEARRKESGMFTEGEVYYLVRSICEVLSFLVSVGQPVLDIHPSKVLLTSERKIKIVRARPAQQPAAGQAWETGGGILVSLTGLMVVVMVGDVNCQEFYNSEDCLIDLDAITLKFEKACKKHHYSEFFRNLISDLLSTDDKAMKYEEVLKIFDTLPAEVQIQSSLFTSDKWSPSKPKSPAETAFQGLLYSSRSGDCDFTAIDEQINRALQRSRETVAKYGKSRNPEQVQSGKDLHLDTDFHEHSFHQEEENGVLNNSSNSPQVGTPDFAFPIRKIELSPNFKSDEQAYSFALNDRIQEDQFQELPFTQVQSSRLPKGSSLQSKGVEQKEGKSRGINNQVVAENDFQSPNYPGNVVEDEMSKNEQGGEGEEDGAEEEEGAEDQEVQEEEQEEGGDEEVEEEEGGGEEEEVEENDGEEVEDEEDQEEEEEEGDGENEEQQDEGEEAESQQ